MDEARRQAYLDALDITRYVVRGQRSAVTPSNDAAEDQESPQPAVTPASATQPVEALDWPALKEAVAGCSACELHRTRSRTVFGVGDQQADLVIIGEAPGADEDRQGEPFVGRAGQLLNAMLQAIGLSREQVYIANIVKCRPPGNRNPALEEAAACRPFLLQQLTLLQPRVILAVGAVAAHNLLDTDEAVGRLRGRVHAFGAENVPLLVSYHPAYLLRRPEEKAKEWSDLQQLYKLLH